MSDHPNCRCRVVENKHMASYSHWGMFEVSYLAWVLSISSNASPAQRGVALIASTFP
jgi:hypothetical protein